MTTEIFRTCFTRQVDRGRTTPSPMWRRWWLDEVPLHENDSPARHRSERIDHYCPPAVQLVALSATVANAGKLTD